MQFFSTTASGAYRAFNAVVIGDVELGAQTSLWFNVTVRGDLAPIRIGARVNLQENVVVHCDPGEPNTIEDDVVVGHGAILHGELIGQGSLIGMGATILNRVRIGRECLIAAGAVLSPGLVVPDRSAVMGVPAKIVRPVRDQELAHFRELCKHYIDLAERYARGEFDAA